MNGYCQHGEKVETCYKCEADTPSPDYDIAQLRSRVEALEEWRGVDHQQKVIDEQAEQIIALQEELQKSENRIREQGVEFARRVADLHYISTVGLPVAEVNSGLKLGEMIWRGRKVEIIPFVKDLEDIYALHMKNSEMYSLLQLLSGIELTFHNDRDWWGKDIRNKDGRVYQSKELLSVLKSIRDERTQRYESMRSMQAFNEEAGNV